MYFIASDEKLEERQACQSWERKGDINMNA